MKLRLKLEKLEIIAMTQQRQKQVSKGMNKNSLNIVT